jgi:hypothetical protein
MFAAALGIALQPESIKFKSNNPVPFKTKLIRQGQANW